MENRLFRSQTDSMIAGVCAGLGHYLGIDATIVRLVFVLFTLAGGVGPLIYLVMWVIVPREGVPGTTDLNEAELRARAGLMRDEFIDFTRKPNPEVWKYFGAILIAMGVLYLIDNLGFPWLWWLDGDLLWPVLLVVVGAILFWRALKGRKA